MQNRRDCRVPLSGLCRKPNEFKNMAKEGGGVVEDELPDPDLKVILLGDSAVGKSKLVERFLMDEYNPRQLSTFALTLFRKTVKMEDTNENLVVGESI